ncbi:hypothetical protein A9Q99_25000 [Gammaproteobacteria bacterium 45_16_T64]|nr:hypothetical protein A9Q99_25000 [Gammaproteobacteria bacterium 45_16_T64]
MSELYDDLRCCPLYDGIDRQEYELLIEKSRRVRVRAGECIFDIGDPAEEIYLITEGCVSFQYHALSGKRVTLGLADPYMVIGDMELLDPTPRKSRAFVIQNCSLIVTDKHAFLALCRRCPVIYERLLKIYSRRLQYAARTMLLKNDEQLLCSILLNLAKRFGCDDGKGIEIQLPLSQEELASYLGTPRQRLNRMLGEFKRQGWIDVSYSKITLLNVEAMELLLEVDE